MLAPWGYWFYISDIVEHVALCIFNLEAIVCSEYGIFGEGSQISTNQNRENSASSLLIGCVQTQCTGSVYRLSV